MAAFAHEAASRVIRTISSTRARVAAAASRWHHAAIKHSAKLGLMASIARSIVSRRSASASRT
jgi:hypothetical protein